MYRFLFYLWDNDPFRLSRIRDCRASGQKVSCWCEHNGIGIKSSYYWMRKIKR
ncbi:IS66 family insertion sequence element accessory protein TnpA [Lacrimispora amygdalina]|uniref:IS66 family insertion sequence element accessory protein TnpA n=1 Tax=Lacrimispora amygdalina TaxID=253257 RepID=UPI003F58916B